MRAHTVSPCILFLLVFLLLASAPPPSSALDVTLTATLTATTPVTTESRTFSPGVVSVTCLNQTTGVAVPSCPSPRPLTTQVVCVDSTNTIVTCPTTLPADGSVIAVVSVITITVDLVPVPFVFPSTGLTIDCSPPSSGPCTGNPQVIAKQSGGVQKLFLRNLRITAPATGCTPTGPCQLKIMAVEPSPSGPSLFDPLPNGPTPAGVFWSGSFNLTGTDPRVDPGDNISLAGFGNLVPGGSTSGDVINAIPGGGVGDSPQSLPSSCSGLSTCRFDASGTIIASFLDSISETSQLTCSPPLTSCPPSAGFTAIVNFGTPGDSLDLPASIGNLQVAGPTQATRGGAAPLIAGGLTPFVVSPDTKLQIGSSTYDLKAPFTLNPDPLVGINPFTDPVYLYIGACQKAPFQTYFPPRSFILQGNGSFAFLGVIGGVPHQASFIPLDTLQQHKQWEFKDQAGPANNLPTAGTIVPFQLTVGDNFGCTRVEAFQ